MAYPGWQMRDRLARNFRFALLRHLGIVPFLHQAKFFAFLDQLDLDTNPTCDAKDIPQRSDRPALRTEIDGVTHWLIARPVFEYRVFEKYGEAVEEPFPTYHEDESPNIEYRYYPVTPSDRQRPSFLATSGAFKLGKSVTGGLIPASFAICPDLAWDFWGMEYDITVPEFEYLLRCLVDREGGMFPKVKDFTGDELKGWVRYKCDPLMSRMYLELSNGATFTARSMRILSESNSDPLKGKERDGFSVCEAYQFPDVQTLLSYRQNLSVRRGYFIAPSTPDRPIMDEINRRCDPENDEFPGWLGVREVHRRENPYAFIEDEYFEDVKTFSREQFSVYWEGKSGAWIGAVYPAIQYFDTKTHPHFWKDLNAEPTPDNFAPPAWMKRVAGFDTGTYFGAASALVDDSEGVFFVGSHCNYRYVAGKLEKLQEVTPESFASDIREFQRGIGGNWIFYTDPNTQWKDEYRRYGIVLRHGVKDPERRCEVARGMAQNGFVWFAPWLRGSELVYEWEKARYPSGGTKRERRIDEDDHVLDPAEHVCAMHPRSQRPKPDRKSDPVRELIGNTKRRGLRPVGDPMLGL